MTTTGRPGLALWVLLVGLAGCVSQAPQPVDGLGLVAGTDLAVRLPDAGFYNVTGVTPAYLGPSAAGFHSLEETAAKVASFEERRPDLVRVDIIGQSREGRPIWDVVVTNEATPGPKLTPLFDGGHHANEYAGSELVLYTIDFLLDNYDTNATVRRWVDSYEIHNVPLVNPDGHVRFQRGNSLGTNLNRNYDVDWGNPLGATSPVSGIVSSTTGVPVQSVPIVLENCGPYAFSEPESRAVRDLMERLHFSMPFYMTYHTPTNGFIAPWAAQKAPFRIPEAESAVFEAELEWVRASTEYKAGKAEWGNFSAGLPYSASGSSMDWAYMRHRVPAFTLEVEIWYTSVTSANYADRVYVRPYDGLAYWMKASLPIPLQLLSNVENLRAWEVPTEEPPLPEGVPPKPPSGYFGLLRPDTDFEAWTPATGPANLHI